MKELKTLTFDPKQCLVELNEFSELLKSRDQLSERDDVKSFFAAREQLTAFIGASIPDIGPANRIAYEFQVFGDFAADVVIGNYDSQAFCAIEFEDARPNSVLSQGSRSVKEWGRRLEHGFGQLVDWFFSFDDHKNSAGFTKHFGGGHVQFSGLLVAGRSSDLSDYDMTRLRWRSDRVTINTHNVFCRTFDDLYDALARDWRILNQIQALKETDPSEQM